MELSTLIMSVPLLFYPIFIKSNIVEHIQSYAGKMYPISCWHEIYNDKYLFFQLLEVFDDGLNSPATAIYSDDDSYGSPGGLLSP